MTPAWRPDVLGEGFEAATITLPDDDEGQVTATLVRGPAPAEPRGAVLYVHGYNDYFFQADLARFLASAGWAFYALDLRKHGRSLLPHQTPNYTGALDVYDAELDEAVAVIGEAHRGPLLVVAHSTGGLTAPLWAARRPGLVSGMVLNSPFLDFKQPPAFTAALLPVVRAVARRRPTAIFPASAPEAYNETLHRSRSGEWDYDLRWKPLRSWPTRYGWLAAVAAGHARGRAGLGLEIPVLALSSSATASAGASIEERQRGDVVLDAGRIAHAAVGLGSDVTIVRVTGGMHDLFLSKAAARAEAYAATGRWLEWHWPGATRHLPD